LFADSADVVELTPGRFNATVLSSKEAWLVDYYADWCPHCQNFAPVWQHVASQYSGDSRVTFGAMDCALYMDFCAGIKVGAYPTMRAYNLPDAPDSAGEAGVALHEGDYNLDEEQELKGLIDAKLAALGPAPLTLAPTPAGPGAPATSWLLPAPAPAPKEISATSDSAVFRLIDAELALVYALRQGTATAAVRRPVEPPDPSDPLALGGEALAGLVAWLDLVSRLLPSSRGRRDVAELAAVARSAQQGSGVLPRAAWLLALDERKVDLVGPQAGQDPTPYWRLCATYTCGLWTLFHILTVAAADPISRRLAAAAEDDGVARDGRRLREDGPVVRQRGLEEAGVSASPTPGETLQRIRGFVENFFGCEECSKHFVATYDSCQFGRCALEATDGQGSALWLWQVHNNVTARVAGERGRAVPHPWPNLAFCEKCWVQVPGAPERWNPTAVFDYLTFAFVPPDDTVVGSGPLMGADSFFTSFSSNTIFVGLVLGGSGIAGILWWSLHRDKEQGEWFEVQDHEDNELSPISSSMGN